MMLRSSSTPLLGSLISSISPESPNNNHHHHHHETTLHPYKFSFHQTLSCHSSPISPSFGHSGLRRAQSESNLESLLISGNGGCTKDDNLSKKHSTRLYSSFLETIPSFSNENSRNGDESIDNEEPGEEQFYDFRGFNRETKVLSLNKQMGFGDLAIKDDLAMYIAKGIGVDAGFGGGDGGDAGTGGGGRNLSQVGSGEGGGDNHDTEEHYRKMVNDNPGNSLFLRNYAQFLYQSKQDPHGAEEYYSRAILVDPNDGEILSQYAKLLWELHRDKDRATSYFERAVQAASKDSHVHAAYASFLWEVEEDENEEDDEEEEGYYGNIPTLFNNGKLASAATA